MKQTGCSQPEISFMKQTGCSQPAHSELEQTKIDTLNKIRCLLEEDMKLENPDNFKKFSGKLEIIAYPNSINNSVNLQFCGWQIVLNTDGTYFWMDTSGG
jgi:hypothetical protein